MSSIHLVDPELVPWLEAAPPLQIDEAHLAETRQQLAETIAAAGFVTRADVTSEFVTIPGADGQPPVRAILHRPTGGVEAPRPVVLHIHGGGMVIGSPEMNFARHQAIVSRHGCVVLAPAYRLAPESAHPAQLDDLWSALSWLAGGAAVDVDPDRIVVMGISAGGGLAAALTMLARGRGGPRIRAQVLVYPMLDDRTATTRPPEPFTGEFTWTADMNRYGWTSLLGMPAGSAEVPVGAVPARAADLAGLPPTFLQVGALDLFVHENIEFARRLLLAGVPTALHVYPGCYHGSDRVPDIRSSRQFDRDCQEYLEWALAG